MRRKHARRITTTITALVLAVGVASAGSAGAQAQSACTATAGKVSLTNTGQVRAPRVVIDCSGSWVGEESLLYQQDKAFQPLGKWSYGGDKPISGSGDAILPAFTRDYHEGCASWKLRVELNGRVYDGPVSHFCN